LKQRSNETKGQALVWTRWVALIAVALAIVLSSVFLLPDYLVEHDLEQGTQLAPAELARAKNDVRSTLLQGIGAVILVVGALAAWRQLQLGREQLQANREQMQHNEELTRLQLKISEQGQVTERFTRAIEQLASDKLDVRLGGIYGWSVLLPIPRLPKT
jgi:cell division protein FtsL